MIFLTVAVLWVLGGPPPSGRRDFAEMALLSMLLSSAWVLLALSFYPVWGSECDEDRLTIRIFPSVMAVLSVLGAVIGCRSMESNQSSCVLIFMYMNSKIVSVVLLFCGLDRLVVGDGVPDVAVVLGIPLLCLQVVKICSAAVAIHRYRAGTPDEKLPNFTSLNPFDLVGRGCFMLGNLVGMLGNLSF